MPLLAKKEEPKNGAPAYVVSMSSLWTIMLTFFITLCNMANEQEYGLVGAGTGSFFRQINADGKPGILPGQRTTIDLGEGRPQFEIPARAQEQTTGSDADLLYRQVISIEPMRLPRALIKFFKQADKLRIPVNVRFAPGSAALSEADKDCLYPLMMRLRTVSYYVRVEVAVNDTFVFNETYESAWELSAARAASITRYFHEQGGMSHRRMEPIGLGSARPFVKNAPDPSVNDRVEIIVLKY
ncbi:MAG TPA: OmpA family protein [Planctomycetota bacterium]|nr:OmpA family protein [Planctomycetota bacterium]